jgi:aspartate carbamoyltransferase regulatory subunit
VKPTFHAAFACQNKRCPSRPDIEVVEVFTRHPISDDARWPCPSCEKPMIRTDREPEWRGETQP